MVYKPHTEGVRSVVSENQTLIVLIFIHAFIHLISSLSQLCAGDKVMDRKGLLPALPECARKEAQPLHPRLSAPPHLTTRVTVESNQSSRDSHPLGVEGAHHPDNCRNFLLI